MTKQQQNTDSLTQFGLLIDAKKPMLKKHYLQLLAKDLSQQKWQGCFQRNIVAVMEVAYQDALAQLQALPFDSSESAIDRGMSALTKEALAVFDGYIDEFLLFAVDTHRTSCALSNFPDEHKPDDAYINEVRHEIASLWQNFALDTNAYFLSCRLVNQANI